MNSLGQCLSAPRSRARDTTVSRGETWGGILRVTCGSSSTSGIFCRNVLPLYMAITWHGTRPGIKCHTSSATSAGQG
eukprot:9467477-Pyramimonas_sp.AAC.1